MTDLHVLWKIKCVILENKNARLALSKYPEPAFIFSALVSNIREPGGNLQVFLSGKYYIRIWQGRYRIISHRQ